LFHSKEFVLADKTKYNLKSFDCKKAEMNLFLSRFAIKNGKLGLSKTWVLPFKDYSKNSKTKLFVAAYFTLASSSVSRDDLPLKNNFPGYPVPIVLLARLAVDKNFQKQRLGEKTLITALRKSVELTDLGLPAVGLILDVLDNDALKFYQKYDMFKPFTKDPMRLFVPINVLRQL